MALLNKKLQKILKEKGNKKKRKTLPQKKNLTRIEQGGISNTSYASNT